MNKFCQVSFIPRSTDFALLVLRLWFGLTMLFNHGIPKLRHFSQMSGMFPDPLHIGSQFSLILSVIAEVLGAALVVNGFATRLAALIVVIELAIVFFGVHHAALAMGAHSGELAFAYLGAFLTIFFAGGGRFVICHKTNDLSTPASPSAGA